MLDNTYGLLFHFFQFANYLRKANYLRRFDSEIYGSADVRTRFSDDGGGGEGGRLIKSDSLYKNLYDYWTCYHASNSPLILFTWYHPKMAKLEKYIQKKWGSTKDLPLVPQHLKRLKKKTNISISEGTWGVMEKSIWKFFNNEKQTMEMNI